MFTVIELAHVVCVDNAAIKKEIYSKEFNELAINWTNKCVGNLFFTTRMINQESSKKDETKDKLSGMC